MPVTGPPLAMLDGGTPAAGAMTNLSLSTAPALPGSVSVEPNRSSVRLYLPGVSGAQDYRVFADESGVTVTVDSTGHEHVNGATIHCAGLRQRNQCDDGEVLPIQFNNSLLDMPKCETTHAGARRPNVPTSLMQTLDVDGVGANTTLVVEAIDRQCPFPGLFGATHQDVKVTFVEYKAATVDATINGKAYVLPIWPSTFPVRTEAEIRAQYGSMIFNGQGPNQPVLDPSSAAFPESPYIRLAQPAPADDPVVLGRAVISVSPTGHATLPDGFATTDYFDDFDDSSDQPMFLRDTDYTHTFNIGVHINVYQTKKWILYDVANEFSQFFVDRGQMNMVMGDPSQDSMSLQAMYPKVPVQLPTASGRYLHVTYEVQRDETFRRYENLALCGSDTAGDTYVGEAPKAAPWPHPGFMNPTATGRTSVLGWNCLYLVPRGAGYDVVPGGDIKSHSDSSIMITVARTQPPPPDWRAFDAKTIDSYVTPFGPTQENPFPNRWLRTIDDSHNISGIWLDDQLNVWQRTKFDVFIRRDQVIIYVNGQQKICQTLTSSPLTMAEGALGFWHILYHTSAEFGEIRAGDVTANPLTGQHHVLHNTPFADQRSWDNVGFRQDVPLPAGFDPGQCY